MVDATTRRSSRWRLTLVAAALTIGTVAGALVAATTSNAPTGAESAYYNGKAP